jgi:hypothetical protein
LWSLASFKDKKQVVVASLVGGSAATVTLLSNGQSDTLALGEGDPGLVALTNDENVGETGGELAVEDILDVDDVETSDVTLTVGDDTDTTGVTTSSDHGNVTDLELDELVELASLQVELDSVVDLDQGIGVTEGTSIVGDDEGDTLGTELNLLDLAQLVLGLLGSDAVDGETTLGIVDQTEVLTGLLDGDGIHESSGVGSVGTDLTIDLDETLHKDVLDLLSVEGVLQTVADQDDQGQALTELVGTSSGAGSIGAGKLVKHPVLGGVKTLQMLFGSTSHFRGIVVQSAG